MCNSHNRVSLQYRTRGRVLQRVPEAELTVRVPRQKRSSKGVHRARPQSATSQAAEQEAMRQREKTMQEELEDAKRLEALEKKRLEIEATAVAIPVALVE